MKRWQVFWSLDIDWRAVRAQLFHFEWNVEWPPPSMNCPPGKHWAEHLYEKHGFRMLPNRPDGRHFIIGPLYIRRRYSKEESQRRYEELLAEHRAYFAALDKPDDKERRDDSI